MFMTSMETYTNKAVILDNLIPLEFLQPLMMLACWVEDPNNEAFKKHLSRVADYVWLREDGIQSFGSQVWDCALRLQSIALGGLIDEIGPVLKKRHEFLIDSQVDRNPTGDLKKMFCHISKGAWTFSDQDHGWQVSDCKAERRWVAFESMVFSLLI